MLNVFVREARNLGISIGAYFEPVNEGAILVEPGSSRLTPAGEVMRLFRPHHGATLLKVEPAADADLDLAASIAKDGQAITITLVNRHPDETREAEIVLGGASAGKATGTLLSAPDFLPGTPMKVSRLRIRAAGNTLQVAMPKHSVAQIRVEVGGPVR
jgi:alpha-L-arabinofuranosidase